MFTPDQQVLENLKSGGYLSDLTIKFYGERLIQGHENVRLFDSFILPDLAKIADERKKIRFFAKAGDPFKKQQLFFPVHDEQGPHWILAIVDQPAQVKKEEGSGCQLRIMDSFNPSQSLKPFYEETHDRIAHLLNQAWSVQRGDGAHPFDPESFPMKVERVPQQKDFVNCGLFVLKCLEKLLDDPWQPPQFESKEASSLRGEILKLLE